MKRMIFFTLCTAILLCSSILETSAQEVTLPEVTVVARNYKYLKSVSTSPSTEVKFLERKAAAYDIKESEFYEDDYDTYYISFYLPKGYVLAVYDQNGKLLHTAEKYKNVALPEAVRKAVTDRYPKWGITDDTYLVTYDSESEPKMNYKLTLRNGNKRLKVKLNSDGQFLD